MNINTQEMNMIRLSDKFFEFTDNNTNYRMDVGVSLSEPMQMELIVVSVNDNFEQKLPVYEVRCVGLHDGDLTVKSEMLNGNDGKPIGLGILVGPYTHIGCLIGQGHKLHRGVTEQEWEEAKEEKRLPNM